MPVLLLYFEPAELDPGLVAQAEAAAPDMRVVVTRDAAAIDTLRDEIEIAAGHVPPELALSLPRLRWLQQWGAGADWLLRHPEAATRDFILTNASGVHAIPISEQIIGTLLMFARGLHRAVRAQERRSWWRPQQSELFELAGKTMLLVGVGAIGARTAEIARSLGMRVEAIRRDPSVGVPGVELSPGRIGCASGCRTPMSSC
nr:MAG: hypothetical protein DIU80_09425 [Chloroflexota bacterium]